MEKKDREKAEAWQQFRDSNEADLELLNIGKDYDEYYFQTKDFSNIESEIGITKMRQPMIPTQFGLTETNVLSSLSELKKRYLEQVIDAFEKVENEELKNKKNEKIKLEAEIDAYFGNKEEMMQEILSLEMDEKVEIPRKNREKRSKVSSKKDSKRREEIKILRNEILNSSGKESFIFKKKLKELINKMESWTPKNKYQDRKKGGNREQFKNQQKVRQKKISEVKILIEKLENSDDSVVKRQLAKLNRKLASLEGRETNSSSKRKNNEVVPEFTENVKREKNRFINFQEINENPAKKSRQVDNTEIAKIQKFSKLKNSQHEEKEFKKAREKIQKMINKYSQSNPVFPSL